MTTLITLIFSAVIAFLTWFILLVSFFGDVTLWILKTFLRSLELILRRLHIDIYRRVQAVSRIGRHPLLYKDRSFKAGILTIAFLVFGIWFLTRDLPSPKQLEIRQIPQTTKIYDRNGKILFNVYEDQNRTIVPLWEVGDNLKKATIAVEDKDFYKHRGFDIYGIIRAVRKTVFEGNIQGGSTITQQLVKSAFLSPERTITRKAKELYLAFRVETAFNKDKILEMYLNQVPYGGTAWGVAAAAEQYFGKNLSDLDLAESALLAGLPAAPTYYSPFGQNPDKALERQKFVLRRMYEEHYITGEEMEAASSEDLQFRSDRIDIRAPHFVMYVRDYLAARYGDAPASHGGLKVTTALDLDIQDAAGAAVTKNVEAVKALNVSNGAALVTKPSTGEILAMVGSKDFFDTSIDGNVNVTIAARQPGSSIKPINYATALSKKLITPATVIVDAPTTFGVPGTKPYSPVNYDGQFHGAVQVRFALANSYNIPAVKVLAISGVSDMIKQAREMGITTFGDESRFGLSLTLGGGEVKMTEMATAFGVFANEGVRQDLVPVLKVEDPSGRILEEFKPKAGKRVLSREVSFLISSILSDNGARSAAFGTSSGLAIGGKTVAVKTGTTDDKRDNWTIGYTPSFLVATWVGNNDNRPMSQNLASGITGATPIWNQIMKFVLKDQVNEAFKVPSGVVGKEICSFTGGPKNDNCTNRFEYFLAGTEPTKDTFVRAKVWVEKETGKIVAPGSPNAEEREEFVVEDPYSKQGFCGSCAPPPSPSPSPSPSPGP
ncbi:penicillin-binding protein [Candidatus Curtissbacteria bacterium]|nr:penicillin-binding protein [Candidatus Curtissbacteria bacterium]